MAETALERGNSSRTARFPRRADDGAGLGDQQCDGQPVHPTSVGSDPGVCDGSAQAVRRRPPGPECHGIRGCAAPHWSCASRLL